MSGNAWSSEGVRFAVVSPAHHSQPSSSAPARSAESEEAVDAPTFNPLSGIEPAPHASEPAQNDNASPTSASSINHSTCISQHDGGKEPCIPSNDSIKADASLPLLLF